MTVFAHAGRWGALVALGSITGCMLGPDAPPDPAGLPAEFSETATTPGLASGSPSPGFAFWRELGDPILNGLVDRALEASPDVARATARIRESRALSGAAWAALFPEVSAGASVERTRISSESPLLSQFGASKIPGFNPDASDFKASLAMAYELDFWGAGRRAREAALYELSGEVERRRSIGLTLAGDVSLAYIDYRVIEARRVAALGTLDSQKAALAIARDRTEGGLSSTLAIARVEADVGGAEAALVDWERLLQIDEHRLSVLTGQPPGALRGLLGAPHGTPTTFEVPVGLPAQLIDRRPDLRELSCRLRAATARIGEAKADLFPRIVLQGEIGLESLDPAKLATRGAAYWAAGPSLRIPLFDWGRRAENWTAAEERANGALHDLEKQILVALQEVEDALVNLREDARRRERLAAVVAAGRRALEISAQSYQGGLTSQSDVIDARRALARAEDALAEAQGRSLRDAVLLAKALGGGTGAAEERMPPVSPPERR